MELYCGLLDIHTHQHINTCIFDWRRLPPDYSVFSTIHLEVMPWQRIRNWASSTTTMSFGSHSIRISISLRTHDKVITVARSYSHSILKRTIMLFHSFFISIFDPCICGSNLAKKQSGERPLNRLNNTHCYKCPLFIETLKYSPLTPFSILSTNFGSRTQKTVSDRISVAFGKIWPTIWSSMDSCSDSYAYVFRPLNELMRKGRKKFRAPHTSGYTLNIFKHL